VAPFSKQDFVLRGIKIVDIGHVSVLYLVTGFAIAFAYDAVLGAFDPTLADQKSLLRVALELAVHLWTIGVVTYIVRNVIELIPFPLDGVHGFDHKRVKELTAAPAFVLVTATFQDHLRAKMKYFYDRMKR
jgi:hypothetical protein